ncbi:MAG: hypothetical protein HY761_09440 [Candidatus Omnitrophica bacterium]|nr:hypothetical protein [Candidatus Omnitrophota bacterium]
MIWLKIAETLVLAALGGLLYRWGGQEGWNTRYRDAGVPLCFCALMVLLGAVHGLWQWISLAPCFGIMWASLTTYRYFLPKPVDYDWYHYGLHGLFCVASAFPYAIASGHWIGFGIRVILCAAGLSGWYFIAKKSDTWHERGRGFILILTIPICVI